MAFYQRIVELWCHAKNFPNDPRIERIFLHTGYEIWNFTFGEKFLSYPCYKRRQCSVKVTSLCDNLSLPIQGLLEAYFFNKTRQWWARKRIHYLREGRIEKSVPHDHRLLSLCKPCDAKRWSPGWIFLSHPHTHNAYILRTIYS